MNTTTADFRAPTAKVAPRVATAPVRTTLLPDARFTVTTSDGVRLAVKTWGQKAGPGRPTVVLVHGYPDCSEVWHAVAADLAHDFFVVAYDVRGAGESSAPKGGQAYRLERLSQDFETVINEVSPQAPVHLVAHDWGSIQSWESVSDARLKGRIASYTSCAGPCLDHVTHWLRERITRPTPSHLAQLFGQLLKSWYIAFFHLPVLPGLMWRLGLGPLWPRLLRRLENTPAEPRAHQTRDGVQGVALYRANFLRRNVQPNARVAHAPVQTLVTLGDKYVSPRLSDDIGRWVPQHWRREVRAGHWFPLQKPALMAQMVREFVNFTEGGLNAEGARPDGVPPPGALRRTRLIAKRLPLSGKVAVVTGAGSGIGRCAALAFAEQGAHIVSVDINAETAERTATLARLIGVDATAARVDVSSAEQMQALADQVQRDWGGADIVVNNAGIGMAGGMLDTDIPSWQRVIGINLWSVIYGARFFGQQMVANGRGGHMLNTASAAAFSPSRSMVGYTTTKAAVLMLSESLRGELAEHRIGVSTVCPGFAETGIMAATEHVGVSADEQAKRRAKATKLYKLRGLQPETVAQAMLRALHKNLPLVTVGMEAHGARFTSRFMPWLSRRIARVKML